MMKNNLKDKKYQLPVSAWAHRRKIAPSFNRSKIIPVVCPAVSYAVLGAPYQNNIAHQTTNTVPCEYCDSNLLKWCAGNM